MKHPNMQYTYKVGDQVMFHPVPAWYSVDLTRISRMPARISGLPSPIYGKLRYTIEFDKPIDRFVLADPKERFAPYPRGEHQSISTWKAYKFELSPLRTLPKEFLL